MDKKDKLKADGPKAGIPDEKKLSGERAMITGRPFRPQDAGMRKQEQLTFNMEDSSPEALLKGGESEGVINRAAANYWSSTEYSGTNAYNVNFNNGNVNNNNKTNNNRVRAVRSSEYPGRLPSDTFSFHNIYSEYLKCRKRKRNTINALKFELDLGGNLERLRYSLNKGTYSSGRSILFAATRPKLREIFAAGFADRVVHHILVGELEKVWEPGFIYDSWARREGKGIHGAAERLQGFIRKVSANGTVKAYYLQLDVRNFFNTINKDILFSIIRKKINDVKLLRLAETVIYHDCARDCIVKGDRKLLSRVPAHRSLFTYSPARGLPIGNLSSQFFANVYLDRLDRYVKHTLRCRYYIRYCDDFILLGRDMDGLKENMDKIRAFLKEELDLELNGRSKLADVNSGIDFLGYVIRRDYVLVRRRVVGSLYSKLNEYREKLIKPGSILLYDRKLIEKLYATLASYTGHFRRADSRRLIEKTLQKFPWLSELCDISPEGIISRKELLEDGWGRKCANS